MKAVYLGGVRGHQSAVYRPGAGWSGIESHRRSRRQPAISLKKPMICACPLTVVRPRRPGLKTKTAIIAVMISLAGLLAIVLSGVQL
jgi:hypothetical protein